ncbi:MAG: septum formation protein Maf [Victivallales bacterium]|nr:septum formation protein Maf [Victivallales bacterium]
MGRREVLLASGSVQRKAILEELGISYKSVAMDVDEVTLESPSDTVRENARLKLLAALPQAQDGQAVMAADTIIWINGQVLGKPGTPEQAQVYLRMLSGNTIEAYSGLAVAMKGAGKGYLCAERAVISIKPLDDSEVEWYIGTQEPIIRAGAIGISHYGEVFVTRIEGSYSCIAGLPKVALMAILSRSRPLAETVLPVPPPPGTIGSEIRIDEFDV